MLFRSSNGVLAVVKNAGGEYRVRVPLQHALRQMFEIAHAAACDHGHPERIAECARELDIETLPRSIAVHAGKQDFARAERLHLATPFDRVEARGATAAVGENLPSSRCGVRNALRIDSDHDALRAVAISGVCNELRILNCGSVDADLVSAGIEEPTYILHAAYASADGERNEHLRRNGFHHVQDEIAFVAARSNVEESELVRALFVVALRNFDRMDTDQDGVVSVAEMKAAGLIK